MAIGLAFLGRDRKVVAILPHSWKFSLYADRDGDGDGVHPRLCAADGMAVAGKSTAKAALYMARYVSLHVDRLSSTGISGLLKSFCSSKRSSYSRRDHRV